MYYTLVYWVYPMKDYVGETGCHITFFLRNAGVFAFQLQSLSMAFFRYICLFHSGSVRKLHISLNVSCKDQIMKPLCLCLQLLIDFIAVFSNLTNLTKKKLFQSACNNNYFCLSLSSITWFMSSENRCTVPIITNHSTLLIFQTMAKLLFLINFLGPMLSYAFVFTSEHTVGLDVCLGKGYFNFFSNQVDLCSYDNIYAKGACMTLWIVYAIGSSNILDAYVIYYCLKEIRNSAEKTKQAIGPQAYINRKR